jgi:hypothetical protein
MRRVAPWLLAVLVLVGGLLALVGLSLIAFWQGLGSALVAVLVGYSILLVLFDHPASRRRSS